MKKIAFIINDMRIGGAERVLANLTMGFPKDWEIDIILSDASEIEYEYRGHVIDLGIRRDAYSSSIFYFLKVLLTRCKILRKLKKEKRYDVCIGFADSANVANILSGNKYCKTISAVHSTLSEANRLKEYKYVVSPLVKLLYNRSDKVIAVSEGVALDLFHNYGIRKEKILTIYNGCDLDSISYKKNAELNPEEEKWFQGKFVIATMGRMDIPKAQWHLIRAFRQVVDKVPNAKLLLLGDGECAEYLRNLARELQLSQNVIFCGFQINPFKILTRCNIFVFPSIYEGFGNAIIEAMYCGLPVIATDFNTGAREILAPKTQIAYRVKDTIECAQYGILTPICDGKQYSAENKLTDEEVLLSKAILDLWNNENLLKKYEEKSIARAKDFSLMQMVENWVNFIDIIGR